AGQASAQTFTTLYNFEPPSYWGPPYTNKTGSLPNLGLLSGNTLYGTAYNYGDSGGGNVFKVKTDGRGFAVLQSFTALPYWSPFTNSDGTSPSGLILSSNTLYGKATSGGSYGNGTVFAVNTDGTGFTNLHTFTVLNGNIFDNTSGTNTDGASPGSL